MYYTWSPLFLSTDLQMSWLRMQPSQLTALVLTALLRLPQHGGTFLYISLQFCTFPTVIFPMALHTVGDRMLADCCWENEADVICTALLLLRKAAHSVLRGLTFHLPYLCPQSLILPTSHSPDLRHFRFLPFICSKYPVKLQQSRLGEFSLCRMSSIHSAALITPLPPLSRISPRYKPFDGGVFVSASH